MSADQAHCSLTRTSPVPPAHLAAPLSKSPPVLVTYAEHLLGNCTTDTDAEAVVPAAANNPDPTSPTVASALPSRRELRLDAEPSVT